VKSKKEDKTEVLQNKLICTFVYRKQDAIISFMEEKSHFASPFRSSNEEILNEHELVYYDLSIGPRLSPWILDRFA